MDFESQKEKFVEGVSDRNTGARKETLAKVVQHENFSPRRFGKALRDGTGAMKSAFGPTQTQAQTLCEKIALDKAFELEINENPASIWSATPNLHSPEHRNFTEFQLPPDRSALSWTTLYGCADADPLYSLSANR